MQEANFASKQYIDAATLNAAFATTSGNSLQQNRGLENPGLVYPEIVVITTTGLVVGANLPSPFSILFGDGSLGAAHGTVPGADTQAYTFDFTPLVPGSGSVTAYLVASNFGFIGQNPVQVVGPPPGHPDYNPTFVPFVSYQTNVLTLQVSGTTTPPDNSTTFELAHGTLAAGASSIALTPRNRLRASANNALGILQSVATTGTLLVSGAGHAINCFGGNDLTLPPASGCAGLVFNFFVNDGVTTVRGNGGELIYGFGGNPSSGVANFVMAAGQNVSILGNGTLWQLLYAQAAYTGAVLTSRQVLTASGLQGGGDLTADRTLSPVYGTIANTVMQGNDARVVNGVQTSRQILTASGLTGGGDLSADRTLSPVYGTTSNTIAAGDDTRIVNAVQTSRQVLTTSGLTGGGALSADRTLSPVYGSGASTVCAGNDPRLSAIALTKTFASAGNSFSFGSAIGPFTHNLGGRPSMVFVSMVCVTNNATYVTGDEVSATLFGSDNGTNSHGITVQFDAVNLTVNVGADPFYVCGTDFAQHVITAGDWTMTIHAYR